MSYGENQRVINEVGGNYMARPIAELVEDTHCVNCGGEDAEGFVGGLCKGCRKEAYQERIEKSNRELLKALKALRMTIVNHNLKCKFGIDHIGGMDLHNADIAIAHAEGRLQ